MNMIEIKTKDEEKIVGYAEDAKIQEALTPQEQKLYKVWAKYSNARGTNKRLSLYNETRIVTFINFSYFLEI